MFPGQLMHCLRDGTSSTITFLATDLLPRVHKRTQAKLSPLLRIALLLRSAQCDRHGATAATPPQLGQNGGRAERRGYDAARRAAVCRAVVRPSGLAEVFVVSALQPPSFTDGHCTVGGVKSGLETGVGVESGGRAESLDDRRPHFAQKRATYSNTRATLARNHVGPCLPQWAQGAQARRGNGGGE